MSDLSHQKPGDSSRKHSNLYLCCKVTTTLLITLLLLIPIIVTLGSDEHVYHQKLIYHVYEANPQIKSTFTDIEAKIKRSNLFDAVNLYFGSSLLEETSPKKNKQSNVNWHNVAQLTDFYGYLFSSQGNSTFRHLMKYPSENISLAKKADSKKLLSSAYDFTRKSNLITYLRTKIIKMLKNITSRLKLKQLLSEHQLLSYPFISYWWNILIEQQTVDNIWITFLDPQNIRYHHVPSFLKKIQDWKKSHQNDRLIIVSRQPIVTKNKKIANIQLKINTGSIFQHVNKGLAQKINLTSLSNRTPKILTHLLKHHQGSLGKVGHFIEFFSNNAIFNQVRNFISLKFLNNKKSSSQGLCKQEADYIQKLNQSSLKKYFKNIVESSKINNQSNLKKEIALYFNIIQMDLCGQAKQKVQVKSAKKQKQDVKPQVEKQSKSKATSKKPKQEKKKIKTKEQKVVIQHKEVQLVNQPSLRCNVQNPSNECKTSPENQPNLEKQSLQVQTKEKQQQVKTATNDEISPVEDNQDQKLNQTKNQSAEKEKIVEQVVPEQEVQTEDIAAKEQSNQKQEPAVVENSLQNQNENQITIQTEDNKEELEQNKEDLQKSQAENQKKVQAVIPENEQNNQQSIQQGQAIQNEIVEQEKVEQEQKEEEIQAEATEEEVRTQQPQQTQEPETKEIVNEEEANQEANQQESNQGEANEETNQGEADQEEVNEEAKEEIEVQQEAAEVVINQQEVEQTEQTVGSIQSGQNQAKQEQNQDETATNEEKNQENPNEL